MRLLLILATSLLGLMLASTASLVVLGQPTEAEAKSVFEGLGCIACHRSGGIAKSWDEIVSKYRASAGRYASLDEYVRAEVSQEVKNKLGQDVNSWSDLFRVMSQLTGKSPDDPGVKTVESYLASLLGAQAPEVTQPPETPVTPTPTPPTEERAVGVSFIVAAVVALVIVVAVALIALRLARG
jgi:cytochrome c551/c552